MLLAVPLHPGHTTCATQYSISHPASLYTVMAPFMALLSTVSFTFIEAHGGHNY